MIVTAFLREILASIWSQKVFTTVSALLIAGATVTILMTSGRSVAAETAVLHTLDQQGTRTLAIQARGEKPILPTALVEDIAAIPLVESAVGFGPVRDVTAAGVPDGPRVGSRTVYGNLGPHPPAQPQKIGLLAWTSDRASQTLGLPSGAGSIRLVDGVEYQVAGNLQVPEYLEPFEPLTVVPVSADDADGAQLSTIVVLARTPQDVALVGRLLTSLTSDLPRENLTIASSEGMAALRSAVSGELTRQARAIVLGVLAAATAVTMVNVWGSVLMRRKDVGRRRALGATRFTIIALVVGQVVLTAAAATVVGVLASLGWLALTTSPAPEAEYVAAVAVALVTAAAVAALVPAAVAANRDPLRELRVP